MRYGIFSDIHSNLEAFDTVLSAYQNENIDKFLCVGDIVGYGSNPRECIKIIKDRNIPTVAGNHDWALVEKFSIEYFNPYAKQAVLWTKDKISAQDKNFLGNLDLIYREDDFCLVHGTLVEPDNFYYMSGLEDAKDSFKIMDTSICFVGHTHRPVAFINEGENIYYSLGNIINIEPKIRYIINVGSVGQPRDRDNRACYCIYDTKENVVEIKRIEYDIRSTQTKIINAGLPLFLANRLSLGQ